MIWTTVSLAKSLSQNPCKSKGEDGAGEVKHRFIVDGFLLPSDENPSETVQPRMTSLYDPATGTEARIRSKLLCLITTRLDVQRVAPPPDQISRVGVVVALVSAEVLSSTTGLRTRTSNRKALQSGFDQSHVMRVGARHRHGQRNAASIRKKGTLGPGFASIRGVAACFFPHPRKPSSSLRPGSANPNRFLPARRIPGELLSRAERTRLGSSSPENIDAKYSTNQSLLALHSTGSPFEGRRGCRRRLVVDRREACPHACRVGAWEEEVRFDPKARQNFATVCAESISSSSLHPHTGGALIKSLANTNSIGLWDRL